KEYSGFTFTILSFYLQDLTKAKTFMLNFHTNLQVLRIRRREVLTRYVRFGECLRCFELLELWLWLRELIPASCPSHTLSIKPSKPITCTLRASSGSCKIQKHWV